MVLLIDDITQKGTFGTYDQMEKEDTVERVVLFMAMELIEFLNLGAE